MKPSNRYYVVYKDGWRIVDEHGNPANDVRYKSQQSASKAKWFLFEKDGRKIIQQQYQAKRGLTEIDKHFRNI